jgi:hypothetical protein
VKKNKTTENKKTKKNIRPGKLEKDPSENMSQ